MAIVHIAASLIMRYCRLRRRATNPRNHLIELHPRWRKCRVYNGKALRCAHQRALLTNKSGWRDLNPRPFDPQSNALPSCATPRAYQTRKTERPGTAAEGDGSIATRVRARMLEFSPGPPSSSLLTRISPWHRPDFRVPFHQASPPATWSRRVVCRRPFPCTQGVPHGPCTNRRYL
jgi:hypothetical protein